MKAVGGFFLGIVVGLGGYAIAQEMTKQVRPIPGVSVPSPSLEPLPTAAQDSLKIQKGDALVSVASVDGKTRFYYPTGWKPIPIRHGDKLTDHPVNVLALEPWSVFAFTGSPTCMLIKIGGSLVKVCQ